jgi:hypothetical protein
MEGIHYVDSSMAVEVQLTGFWFSRFQLFLQLELIHVVSFKESSFI